MENLTLPDNKWHSVCQFTVMCFRMANLARSWKMKQNKQNIWYANDRWNHVKLVAYNRHQKLYVMELTVMVDHTVTNSMIIKILIAINNFVLFVIKLCGMLWLTKSWYILICRNYTIAKHPNKFKTQAQQNY